MKVALHSCCGPCASACVPRLKELGHEPVMYFANSNLDSAEEYERRLAAARVLAAAEGVELVAAPYDHEEWLREVAAGYETEPEKGKRCDRCFRYNLAKTAAFAATRGLDAFTTSLTVSPHKVSERVFSAGEEAEADSLTGEGEDRGVPSGSSQPVFLAENFKKHEGFKRSLVRSAELGLYRQTYCGCEFSGSHGR